jgi:hypothetical protein
LLAVAAALGGCNPSNLGNPPPDGGPPDVPPPDVGPPDRPSMPDVMPAPDVAPQPDGGPPDSIVKPDVSPEPDPITRTSHYQASNRNVDLLFLVDDSSSMRLSQTNLLRNFPILMQTLKNQPDGLPNVHIGVISSDMGAGDGSISGCDATGGKNGILQYTPRGTCTSSGLDPGATYISDIDGVRNYTGNLEDVFTCIAALGESGCGFEHQFAAVTRALGADGFTAPLENAGFLRPDALLMIVLITNEDDCSAAPGIPLYDTAANLNLASQLGPPANFRCNEFGHMCGGMHPGRLAPNNGDVTAMVSYADCVSNDTEGYLLSTHDTANRIRALKADDGQIMLAAITGPQTPYTVTWRNPSTADTSCGLASCPWPQIAHSCMATDGSFADPAVRIAGLVGEFGANGRLLSICDGEFGSALSNIGNDVLHYVTAPCIMGRIAKRADLTHDNCTVVDNQTGNAIPDCADTGGTGACWRLVPGTANGCAGVTVSVQADPQGTAPAPQDTTVDCQLCTPGVTDPTRACP